MIRQEDQVGSVGQQSHDDIFLGCTQYNPLQLPSGEKNNLQEILYQHFGPTQRQYEENDHIWPQRKLSFTNSFAIFLDLAPIDYFRLPKEKSRPKDVWSDNDILLFGKGHKIGETLNPMYEAQRRIVGKLKMCHCSVTNL